MRLDRSLVFVFAFTFAYTAESVRSTEFPERLQVQNELGETHSVASNIEAEKRIAEDMRFLASDELRGRGPGTGGLDIAADYIAKRWISLGLDTRLFDDQPFQTFKIPGSVLAADSQDNSLQSIDQSVPDAEKSKTYQIDQDFRALSIGGNGKFEGPLCFVGYGISANESDLQYDEYGSIDARGKVVVIIRKEPQQADANSKFDGTSASKFAFFSSKYANAVAHGAVGVLFVNDSISLQGSNANGSDVEIDLENDRLPGVEDAGRSNGVPSIPALFVKRKLVESWIAKQSGMSLSAIEKGIDRDLKPRSVDIPAVRVSGSVKLQGRTLEVKNVICRIPGVGPLASESIVIGAHYDHVGMGGPGSLSPGVIAIHNGADDNASGTAALLDLSYRLAPWMKDETTPRRQIILIAFTGEERGLLGSRYYVNHPRFPVESISTMINMDMVGRMSDRQLIIYGTGTGSRFPELIDRVNQNAGFLIRKQPEGMGPSDHQPFFERKVPVLHFFTGLHTDYHRPSDDFEKINTDGIAGITDMVYQMSMELAKSPDRPSYIAVQGKADIRLPIVRRARLGVRLMQPASDAQVTESQDSESNKNNFVRVESVAEGSPASKASLKPMDTILSIDSIVVDSPQSLINVLNEKSPGDSVTLEIQRGNEKLSIPVQLGQ